MNDFAFNYTTKTFYNEMLSVTVKKDQVVFAFFGVWAFWVFFLTLFNVKEYVYLLLAACFLEHWKRRQMCLKHSWDLTSLEDEEVQ